MKKIFAIALACAAVSSAAAAQTTTSTCSYVGAYIQCNTNTHHAVNFGGQALLPQQYDMGQAVSNGIKLGQQARVAAALRDFNIHDPESVNRTINILVQNGATDQAMALQNIVNQRR